MSIDDDNGAGSPAGPSDLPLRRANVDRAKSRDEALLQFTTRERLMIDILEQIATGTAGGSHAQDLEIVRDLASETLEAVGWPTVRQELNQST